MRSSPPKMKRKGESAMPKARRTPAESKDSAPEKKKRSRLRRWMTVLVIFAVLVAMLLTAAALLLSPPPAPMGEFSAEDAELQQRILSKVYNEVFNRRPPVEAEIRFTPDEMNSLLRCTVFGVSTAEQFGAINRTYAKMIRSGYYVYRPGVFTVEIPIARTAPWLFGGVAVLRLEGFPAKYDGKFDLTLQSCRIGKFPLPAGEVESRANREFAKHLKRADMLCFDRAIKSIEAQPDGTVVVVYRPPELLRLLVNRKGLK